MGNENMGLSGFLLPPILLVAIWTQKGARIRREFCLGLDFLHLLIKKEFRDFFDMAFHASLEEWKLTCLSSQKWQNPDRVAKIRAWFKSR